MIHERYRRLRAVLVARTAAAARLDVAGVVDWVPLSHLGRASDRAVAAAEPGAALTVYVPEWSADQRGWHAVPGTADLFSAR